ncbi:MAG TPA: hypothetical protein DHN29_11220 [Cytophagales bacterium]|nr:hypothetical protein [Cytophagales bacterium]|tara:strand:- start:994 stop:1308 length:315 start_codon:yes stop_codon:yes gene_type:complete
MARRKFKANDIAIAKKSGSMYTIQPFGQPPRIRYRPYGDKDIVRILEYVPEYQAYTAEYLYSINNRLPGGPIVQVWARDWNKMTTDNKSQYLGLFFKSGILDQL